MAETKNGANKVLFACSGASNTGEMSDLAARRIWAAGKAKRSCLAAIGAGVPAYLESAKLADNLVVDGCPVACGRKAFEGAGLPFRHLLLTDHGVEKGKTAVEEAVVSRLAGEVEAAFGL